jgi:hypothetical protein
MARLPFRTQSSRANAATLDGEAYVTDGTRLFRVVEPMRPLCGRLSAVLEDCVTLESHAYTAADLWEMRVRLVKGATAGG